MIILTQSGEGRTLGNVFFICMDSLKGLSYWFYLAAASVTSLTARLAFYTLTHRPLSGLLLWLSSSRRATGAVSASIPLTMRHRPLNFFSPWTRTSRTKGWDSMTYSTTMTPRGGVNWVSTSSSTLWRRSCPRQLMHRSGYSRWYVMIDLILSNWSWSL